MASGSVNLGGGYESAAPAGAAGGDLSGTYPNPSVSEVGGSLSSLIHDAEVLANAATNLNTASAIVKRDASGNFSAGTITATLSGNATSATSATSATNATTAVNFSGNLAGDVTGPQGTTAIAAATVTGKALTGYTSGAGTVAATDTILQAIQKLDGNDGLIKKVINSYSGDQTLSAANCYARYTGSGGHSFTLPAATGTGIQIIVKHAGTGQLTITRAGSDTIDGQISFIMGQYDVSTLVDAASGVWEMI
jgi:hypothetical protein